MIQLPHSVIPLESIHPTDIFYLFLLSFSYSFLFELFGYFSKNITKKEMDTLFEIKQLRVLAAKKRALGPSAFVETSKLERVILKKNKYLQDCVDKREADLQILKLWKQRSNYVLHILVFIVYYGVPLAKLDGYAIMNNDNAIDASTDAAAAMFSSVDDAASKYLKGLLFPLSYVGVGYRLAQWTMLSSTSLATNVAINGGGSLSAFVVLWTGQVTSEQLFGCLFKLLSR